MSKYYKLVLFIRFTGYVIFFTGFFSLLFILGPLIQVEFNYRLDQLMGVKRTVPNIITSDSNGSSGSFGNLKTVGETITPIDTNFGIVIEKINANAKVVANVDPSSEREYYQALTLGVAHAKGTSLPGEKGNIYLFSHSTDAPWNIVRFNAIFYLLKDLSIGDEIVVFFENRRHNYVVTDSKIVDSSDVSVLTKGQGTNQEVLILQTCWPPGTTWKRLLVFAKPR